MLSEREKESLLLDIATKIAAGAVAHVGIDTLPPDVIVHHAIQIAAELIKQTSKEVAAPKAGKKSAKLYDRKAGKMTQ